MLGKNDIRDAILSDCEIAKHLHGKIPDGGLDYSPSEGQRTTLDLLRYLAFCGMGGTLAMHDGNWDGYASWRDRVAEMPAEDFPAAMDAQMAAIREFFDGLSDEDFASKEATTPLGQTMPLGRALLELPVKWMTAYRMQLFLYCKAAGNDEIWTPNCWGGVDMERTTPAPA